MPRLTADSREEFVEYIRRKVIEGITSKEDHLQSPIPNGREVAFKDIRAMESDSDNAHTVEQLINIAIERQIKIPVRIAGKIVNIADNALIEKMTYDTGRRISGKNSSDRTSLSNVLSSSIIHAFGTGVDPKVPGRKYKPTALTVYVGYAISHGAPHETIIFPSGRLSKGKP